MFIYPWLCLIYFPEKFSGCFKSFGKLSMQVISSELKCLSLYIFSFFELLFESLESIILIFFPLFHFEIGYPYKYFSGETSSYHKFFVQYGRGYLLQISSFDLNSRTNNPLFFWKAFPYIFCFSMDSFEKHPSDCFFAFWMIFSKKKKKTFQTLPGPVTDPAKLPKWNYDGSSTNQAPGDNSEVII